MMRNSLLLDYSYELFVKWYEQNGSGKMSFVTALEIVEALNVELVTFGRSKLFDIICQNLSMHYNGFNVSEQLVFINVNPCDVFEDDLENQSSLEIILYFASLIKFQSEIAYKTIGVNDVELTFIKEALNTVDNFIFEQRTERISKVNSIKSEFNYKTSKKIISLLEESISSVNHQMRQLELNIIEKQNFSFYNKLISIYYLVSDTYLSINSPRFIIKNKELLKNKNNMKQIIDLVSEYLTDYGIEVLMSSPNSKFDPKTQRLLNENSLFNPNNSIIERSYRVGFRLDDQILEKEIVLIKE